MIIQMGKRYYWRAGDYLKRIHSGLWTGNLSCFGAYEMRENEDLWFMPKEDLFLTPAEAAYPYKLKDCYGKTR